MPCPFVLFLSIFDRAGSVSPFSRLRYSFFFALFALCFDLTTKQTRNKIVHFPNCLCLTVEVGKMHRLVSKSQLKNVCEYAVHAVHAVRAAHTHAYRTKWNFQPEIL